MRITSVGNVGIGTTSPDYPLEIENTNQTSIVYQRTGVSAKKWGFISDNGATYWSNITDNILPLTLQNGGNVGIGTTSPLDKLDVFGNQFLGDGTNTSQLYLRGVTGVSYAWTVKNLATGYQVKSTSPGAGDGFNIDFNNNVGIGTTSPSSLLEISGSAPILTMNRTSGSFTNTIDFKTGGNPVGSIISNSAIGEQRYSIGPSVGWGGYHTFYTDTSERMRITSGGNVGIGTTTPSSRLHVYSSGEISRIESSTTTLYQTFRANGTDIGYIGNGTGVASGGSATDFGVQAPNNFVFATGGSAERMRITSAGNVGIGTTSPSAKLDVVGDALINNVTIGRGPGNISTNTAIGTGALDSTTTANYNIALGWAANVNNNANGLTAIGVDLNVGPDTNNLGQDCLAISQFNSNADSAQVPHIYAPKPISIGGGATNIITFDLLHYAGAIVEYMIRLDDGGDYAVGTVYMGWKSSGSGNMIDKRQIEWSNMSGFVFSLGGSGQTLVLTNTSGNNAWIRITVRGMMTN